MLRMSGNEMLDKWVESINFQSKIYTDLTPLEIEETILDDEQLLALRFLRLHETIQAESLADWVLSEWKVKDFEILFEYIEKGYVQGIYGFTELLEIFQFIALFQQPQNYSFSKEEVVECEDCEGTGGTYVAGKCTTCNGKGKIKDMVEYNGRNETAFREDIGSYHEMYINIGETNLLKGFAECVQRLDEEVEDIHKAIKKFEKKKHKPLCKFIGEDGNVFNLLSISASALRKEGLVDEEKELTERVWSSNSYHEALHIMQEYVEVC